MILLTKSRPIKMREHPTPGRPTPAQAEAGNYRKPIVEWQGLRIAIENPAGSTRSGTNRDGKSWSRRMHYAYGEFVGTLGVDGDPVDVFLGANLEAPVVYVVHQRKVNRWDEYDEDKCMVGFDSEAEAVAAFLSCYDDPRFLGPVTALPVAEFIAKLRATVDRPAMIKASAPLALFLKGYVGSYMRRGRMVSGYQGRDARAAEAPGQMTLFAAQEPEKQQRNASNLINNQGMNYLTNAPINTSSVAWETAKGEVKVLLLREASLGPNGWIPAASHAISVTLAGEQQSFYDAVPDPQNVYCMKVGFMGRITVRVPADKQEAVKAMLAEREQFNDAASRAAQSAENDAARRARGVENLMTAGGGSY